MTTRLICNALAVGSLTASIAAIDCIRPFGIKCFSAALANLDSGRLRQTPLLQLLAIAGIAAFLVIAVLFRGNSGIKNAPTALTNDFMDRIIFPIWTAFHFSLIASLQNILMLVLPIAIPHGFLTSFIMGKSGPQYCEPLWHKFTLFSHLPPQNPTLRVFLRSAAFAFCCVLPPYTYHSNT